VVALETIMGQLYLAIVVAWLVGSIAVNRSNGAGEDRNASRSAAEDH
jgi:hypothetical protein